MTTNIRRRFAKEVKGKIILEFTFFKSYFILFNSYYCIISTCSRREGKGWGQDPQGGDPCSYTLK